MEFRPRNNSEIAKRFRAVRKIGCMTQGQLAGLLGLSRQAVNEIENCRVMPHYSTRDKFDALERRHERARALTQTLAAEIPPWRRNITKDDSAQQSDSALKCAKPL
jgi:DNA-binding XRE family transcriptional regulator